MLRNHFGIRDAAKLKEIETDISVIRQNNLLASPIQGRFSSHHLCAIHRYLLGDVYSFAGHFRREDIAKGETRFLSYKEIKSKLRLLLQGLTKERYWGGLDFETFAERSAYYFAELNYIHPFREGNGRAIREFMRELFDRNGLAVDWSAVSVDTLMDAMAYDTAKLVKVLRQCIRSRRNDT